ncbi:uncharacterized protein LOC141791855 [Halichoeres trimaculatus]|uniref:uncharacterized protein LOC141791855 n=1 Tax=Halichoeres trimaculatus TaxID=147232 RepID=UPI003D9E88B1
MKLHRADVQLLMVKKEELPPEQLERSPYPDQEDHESPLIKEEQEEVWISQGREQLQELEEADTKVLFTSVHVKSEHDDEKPELHQRLTDHMETAAGGEDCGEPEPARSSETEINLQPEIEVKIEASSDTGSGSEDGEDDWKEIREFLKRFKSGKNKRSETEESHNCPEPGTTNHVVSQTELRPFSCSECDKRFYKKGALNSHMFVHNQERPFSCSECGKRFYKKGALKSHMFVHTQEKPFSCSECERSFSQKQNLTKHMFVHAKEKSFSCSECGKSFNQKQNLTRHMFVHATEKPYSCSECGKRFNQKPNLTRHMFVHLKEKPFSCSGCGKGFNHKVRLTTHDCALKGTTQGFEYGVRPDMSTHNWRETSSAALNEADSLCIQSYKVCVFENFSSSLTLRCEEMSEFQEHKDLFERQLLTAVSRDLDEQRSASGYEEELQRQQKPQDVILNPEIKPHRGDVQLLMVKKEELSPEQQDNESPLIKEEQEEVWISQGREQLQGLEEADTKVLFTSVHVKNENDDEKPEPSLLHQRLTDHMETAAGGEDCGEPEPARSSETEINLHPEIEVKIEASSDTETGSEDGEHDWKVTRDHLIRFKSTTNERAETEKSHTGPESGTTNHVVSLTEKRTFSCSECGKRFKRKACLVRHMIVHTKEKPFSCSECGKTFNDQRNLTRHMFVHTQEKPFSCSVCGKGFNQKPNLTRHMFLHSEEKPFSCPECGKGLITERDLTSHMLVHTQERPFSCSECGKRFNHKESMTRHMLVHTQERPFSCTECGKRFNHKESLTVHLFVHTKEKLFSCSECGEKFHHKGALTSHMSVHTQEKPFSCSECGKRFSQKGHLTIHMFVHNQEFFQMF